jgi:hypothetical protein
VCHDRSLALTLTWRRHRAARRVRAHAAVTGLIEWPVASGRAEPWPPVPDRRRLWTQVPVVRAPSARRRSGVAVITPLGRVVLPPHGRAIAARLAAMPALEVDGKAPSWLATLLEAGILGDEDLPQVIVPSHPARLDGWQFR